MINSNLHSKSQNLTRKTGTTMFEMKLKVGNFLCRYWKPGKKKKKTKWGHEVTSGWAPAGPQLEGQVVRVAPTGSQSGGWTTAGLTVGAEPWQKRCCWPEQGVSRETSQKPAEDGVWVMQPQGSGLGRAGMHVGRMCPGHWLVNELLWCEALCCWTLSNTVTVLCGWQEELILTSFFKKTTFYFVLRGNRLTMLW